MLDQVENRKRLSASALALMMIAVGTVRAQDPPLMRDGIEGELTATPSESKPPQKARRITLDQVRQQRSVDPVSGPLARLGQLSIEAARQHRLGVQADYFPKLGATFANLHYSEFLGQVLSVRRPIQGTLTQVPVPLLSQNQTFAAITFVQPITPLFQIHQAVRIARADETHCHGEGWSPCRQERA